MRRYLHVVAVGLLVLAAHDSFAAEGAATSYPNRPIRLISPFPPGGGNDTMARAIGGRLNEVWNEQIVVDNRAGANGIVACEIVARAAPDGYTLLMANVGSHAINPTLYKRLPYDAIKDYTPVSQLGWAPNILVLHQSVAANDVKELVALGKAKPGYLTYGSNGTGSSQHLAGVLFGSAFGIELVHVPYRGTAPVLVDLLGGHLKLSFSSAAAVMPHVKTGRLKAIAVTSLKRVPSLPDIPAIAETLPGYEATTWWGIVGPAGIAKPIAAKLSHEIGKALSRPEMIERFSQLGAEPHASTPAEFLDFIKSEIAKWAKVVKVSGAQAN